MARGLVLIDDAGGHEGPRDRGGAAVVALGHLHAADLDAEVVDAEPRHRREHVLHGVHFDPVLLEDRAPAGPRIEMGVLGADLDLGVAGQVGADEADPVPHRRGRNRVIAIDLHAPQIQGFFDVPIDHLVAEPILTEYFKGKGFNRDELVIVSPDHGGVTRARKMADRMKAPIAIIDKRRPRPNVAEVMNIVGNVEGKTAILIDDIIDTAGTITIAASALIESGAKEVYACCTHPVLSGPAIERIDNSKIKELVVTNSIELSEAKASPKIQQLSIAKLLGDAIVRVLRRSLSVHCSIDCNMFPVVCHWVFIG